MFKREAPKETKYEDISDEFLREDLRGLAAKLKSTVVDNEMRLSMPIGEFERKWLALFIGQPDPNNPIKGIPTALWYNEVTTNPYTWVDILLPDGSVAYSVPPLLNSKGLQVQHVDFFHHIMELEAMATHGASKQQLDNYREKYIMQFIGHDSEAETYMNEINKMAMFHGYAPFTKSTSQMDQGSTDPQLGESKGFGESVRVDEF